MSTLITPNNRWNVPEVYRTFNFPEAKLILSIPLVFDNGDHCIWHFTQNERYMVKSGYWTALEYQQLAHSSSRAGSYSSSLSLPPPPKETLETSLEVEGAPQGPTFYVAARSEYPSNP